MIFDRLVRVTALDMSSRYITMSASICFALLCVAFGPLVETHEHHVSCYLTSWSRYRENHGKFVIDDVNPDLCTHVVYSFLFIEADTYELKFDEYADVHEGGFKKALLLKDENPNLKVTVAVGGSTENPEKFTQVASSPASRRNFIQSVVSFFSEYQFDGLVLDWSYPASHGVKPEDKENFVTLIKELRQTFSTKKWILSATTSRLKEIIDAAYDLPELSKYLDYFYVSTYNYHQKEDMKTGHNAPLYHRTDETEDEKKLNVNFTIQHYISLGAPAEKLILGLAFYGKSFLLKNESATGFGVPTRKSAFSGPYTKSEGILSYYEICAIENEWSVEWQEEHKVPYMFKSDKWIGFDNKKSLGIKVDYAKQMGLGGVSVWSTDFDDFSGFCGEPYPLLSSIKQNIAGHSKFDSINKTSAGDPNGDDYSDDIEDSNAENMNNICDNSQSSQSSHLIQSSVIGIVLQISAVDIAQRIASTTSSFAQIRNLHLIFIVLFMLY